MEELMNTRRTSNPRHPHRISKIYQKIVLWAALFSAVCFASPHARALTAPIAGAVAFPSNVQLHLPFPAGAAVRLLSGYSPSGGSSLHADTNACCKANDYYALDLVYENEPNSGKGKPILAPLDGKVIRAGWATAGWANYGQRIILQHDLGDGHIYHSLYAHLDSIDVAEGGTVKQGQPIGTLGQSCQGALSCGSFSTPHMHWAIHRDSTVGGSGTGGSYGGNAVVPEPLDGAENLAQNMIITSSNTGMVVCGDGFCSGNENNATCPQDCPACEQVPPAGRVISEDELCFEKGGNPMYWYTQASGHNGSQFWTNATSDPNPDNYAIWNFDFAEAGDYSIEIYSEPGFAQSKQAGYQLVHGGGQEQIAINQSAADNWKMLGTFPFNKGGGQSLRLNDNTGEPLANKIKLVFDAIRVTRIGGVNPGTGGGGGSSAGTGGNAAGTGGNAAGTGGQGVQTPDGNEDGGCGCRAAGHPHEERAPLAWLVPALLSLGALRRRKHVKV